MKPSFKLRWRLILASASLLGLLLLSAVVTQPAAAGPASQGDNITFSGRAVGLQATVLGVNTTIADTGPLPSSGGSLEASLLTANVPGLVIAEAFHAATVGQGDRSRSEASVANVNLTAGGNTISAGFLMARAMAQCSPGGPTVSGSSEIVTLVINGQTISVSGAPNQTIALPNGRVVINEQTQSQSANAGDITVNALHIVVDQVADVVVSSAHADITCNAKPVCDTSQDFVTGGGWITGTPSGAKANFGVAGGIKNGSFWGHLTYIDHGASGPKVKGTGVTAYTIVDANTRHIEGTAEIDGQSGFTYQVDVADNGEPGRNDSFVIRLSNGYSASGLLGGGNIQIHKPCQ